MRLLLFVLYIISTNLVECEDVGDECSPNDTMTDGICTIVTDCEEAVRAIRNKNFHRFQRCGFSGSDEIVCCPQTINKFGGTSTNPPKTSKRIADIECDKIIARSIPPINLNIIGGEMAGLGEFPHMVGIGFDRGNGYEFDCGGTLISKTYVLTAAHCIDTLDRIEPSMIRAGVVEIGSSKWNDETDIRIASITLYPSYTRREKYHDIALLRLEQEVEETSNAHAACLYTSDSDPTIPLTITGWGQTSTSTERRSRVLLKANVTVVKREQCDQLYTKWRKLPRGIGPEQICAGDPDGLRDTCQGDSGGPLQGVTSNDDQYRLIGITSFGRGCGSYIPGVYTRVSHYLDWIERVVWPNS